MSVEELKRITAADIKTSKKYAPQNITKRAKVVKIYDGDTCHLVVSRNGRLKMFKCRLADIDTPEMKARKTKERKKAKKARDFLAWLCIGKYPKAFSRRSNPWTEKKLQNKLNKNKNLVHVEFRKLGRYRRCIVQSLSKVVGTPTVSRYICLSTIIPSKI